VFIWQHEELCVGLAFCDSLVALSAIPLCCSRSPVLSQHEELREKLRIVRTVLEQGGTFAGINRKVQLKPTKWSTASKPQPADSAEGQPAAPQNTADQQPQQPPQPQQQGAAQGSKEKLMHGDGTRSARTSSTGGAASGAGPADGKPHVTELLLILKYGGVLTHAGRAQAEELGKTFRMVMYPRCVVGMREGSGGKSATPDMHMHCHVRGLVWCCTIIGSEECCPMAALEQTLRACRGPFLAAKRSQAVDHAIDPVL
jgi:hypothetical protein